MASSDRPRNDHNIRCGQCGLTSKSHHTTHEPPAVWGNAYKSQFLHLLLLIQVSLPSQHTSTIITLVSTMDKYNSQWVEFHIRDHLKDGEVLVQNTVIEGYCITVS